MRAAGCRAMPPAARAERSERPVVAGPAVQGRPLGFGHLSNPIAGRPPHNQSMAPTGTDDRDASAVAHEDPTELMDTALAGVDLTRLADEVARRLRGRGVTFGSAGDDFRVDPVPRVISAAEWAPLAAGLAQRVRALNRFVADVYGAQRVVSEGVVPHRAIISAEYFEPELVGLTAPPATWIPLAGLDVVRDPAGDFKVLEDNVRTRPGSPTRSPPATP